MKLIKNGKFYIVILEKIVKKENLGKNKQKYWNNRKWKFRRNK